MNIVLLERTSGTGVHEFALCLPARAAEEVSIWACGPDPLENSGKAGEALVRTIEIIRPGEAGPSRHRLAIFVGRESTVVGEFDDQGEIATQVPITVKDLGERLSSMLADAGRLGSG
jgi:hypothetical protein